MKANFKISKPDETKTVEHPLENNERKDITDKEFEEFLVKAGAAGSFMVFRSDKNKDDELGLDEL